MCQEYNETSKVICQNVTLFEKVNACKKKSCCFTYMFPRFRHRKHHLRYEFEIGQLFLPYAAWHPRKPGSDYEILNHFP